MSQVSVIKEKSYLKVMRHLVSVRDSVIDDNDRGNQPQRLLELLA